MGCGTSAPAVAGTPRRASLSLKNPGGTNSNSNEVHTALRTHGGDTAMEDASDSASIHTKPRWVAGYLMDEEESGPFNTYEDYRGFATTINTSASRNKADTICRWADGSLDELKELGGVFFNPQNQSSWPADVYASYEAHLSEQADRNSRRDRNHRSNRHAAATHGSK